MPNSVTLKFDGLATIETALRTLPQKVQNEVLGQALAAGAEVVRAGVAAKIHSRTGKTADDLHVEVQVKPDDVAGAAIVGANKTKGGRDYVMHFLEGGTRPHAEPKKGAVPRIRLTLGGRTVTRRGPAPKTPLMSFGGRVFAKVRHPGTKAQAPMRLTVAQQGIQAVNAFTQTAWAGIRKHIEGA